MIMYTSTPAWGCHPNDMLYIRMEADIEYNSPFYGLICSYGDSIWVSTFDGSLSDLFPSMVSFEYVKDAVVISTKSNLNNLNPESNLYKPFITLYNNAKSSSPMPDRYNFVANKIISEHLYHEVIITITRHRFSIKFKYYIENGEPKLNKKMKLLEIS